VTLFYWGEENNPAHKGSVTKKIDPTKVVKKQRHTLNEKAVQVYVENPRRESDDGDVCVRERGDGTFEYYGNGAHRIEAARRTGRTITARVYPKDHRR
jgi:hypothetical protein